MILRHCWLGLEPTSPVHWAEMLTTRPPWSQNLFLLQMLLCWFPQLISANHFIIGSFVFLEYILNFFTVLHTLYSSWANQSSVTLQVQVVSHSEFSHVTLGFSRLFSIIHGDWFNTLFLFTHSTLTSRTQSSWHSQVPVQWLPQLFITELSNHFVKNSWERWVEESGLEKSKEKKMLTRHNLEAFWKLFSVLCGCAGSFI